MPINPKTWQGYPATTTPIDAPGLIDLETRLSTYTDQELEILVGLQDGVLSTFPRTLATVALAGTSNFLYSALAVGPTGGATYTKAGVLWTSVNTATGFRVVVWDWTTGNVLGQTGDTVPTANTYMKPSFLSPVSVTSGQALVLGIGQTYTGAAGNYMGRNTTVNNFAHQIAVPGYSGVIYSNPGGIPAWAGVGNTIGAMSAAQRGQNSANIPYLELVP